MSISDDNYVGIILEEIRDQNKAVLEAVGQIQDKVETLPTKEELHAFADDVKIVKAAVIDLSKQQIDHERRITHLEAA